MGRFRPPLGLVAGLWVLLPACGQDDRMSAPPPPPAAMVAPVHSSMPLDEMLRILEQELEAALRGRLENEAAMRVIRAEAITDRLLEAQLPMEWLAEGYLLEARLRQLQTQADLIMAQMRRGADRNRILPQVLELYQSVGRLRESLRQPGGGPAPPPLDTLLARYTAQAEEP